MSRHFWAGHPAWAGRKIVSQLLARRYFFLKAGRSGRLARLSGTCCVFSFCMAASSPPPTPPLATGADFGPVAAFYDALAGLVFGGALRQAQRAALAAGLPPGPAPRLLVLGGGGGLGAHRNLAAAATGAGAVCGSLGGHAGPHPRPASALPPATRRNPGAAPGHRGRAAARRAI